MPGEVTQLLSEVARGRGAVVEEILPLVYDQLRAAAQRQLAAERSGGAGHTLSATALVHEAYLKLIGPREIPWAGRGHFYAAAAQAMRRILVDHARSKAAGGWARPRAPATLALANVAVLSEGDNPGQILAVDEALTRLEGRDADAASVVRLRFYAGLSVEETASALGLSERTVFRLWQYARAVMFQELSRESA